MRLRKDASTSATVRDPVCPSVEAGLDQPTVPANRMVRMPLLRLAVDALNLTERFRRLFLPFTRSGDYIGFWASNERTG